MRPVVHYLTHTSWGQKLFLVDPGLSSLYKVTRAVANAASNVLLTMLILHWLGQDKLIQAPLLAGLLGILPNFAITDQTSRQRQITLLIAGLSAAVALCLGTLLHPFLLLKDLGMLLIVFFAFYLRRFGNRFIPIGMITFIGYYFTFFIPVTFSQLPYLLLGEGIGMMLTFLFMFVLLPERPLRTLHNLQHSWNVQAGKIFNTVTRLLITDKNSARKKLEQEIASLASLTTTLENTLGNEEVIFFAKKIPPETMRVYYFNSLLAVITIARLLRQCISCKPAKEDVTFLRHTLGLLREGFIAVRWETKQAKWSKALTLLEHANKTAQQTFGSTLQSMASEVSGLLEESQALRAGKRYAASNSHLPQLKMQTGHRLQPTTKVPESVSKKSLI